MRLGFDDHNPATDVPESDHLIDRTLQFETASYMKILHELFTPFRAPNGIRSAVLFVLSLSVFFIEID